MILQLINISPDSMLIKQALTKYVSSEEHFWNQSWFAVAVGFIGIFVGFLLTKWNEKRNRHLEERKDAIRNLDTIRAEIDALVPEIEKQLDVLIDSAGAVADMSTKTITIREKNLPSLTTEMKTAESGMQNLMRSFNLQLSAFSRIADRYDDDEYLYNIIYDAKQWTTRMITEGIKFNHNDERTEKLEKFRRNETLFLRKDIMQPLETYLHFYYTKFVRGEKNIRITKKEVGDFIKLLYSPTVKIISNEETED